MWLQEHAFISGKAVSCNLWATSPQWLNAAHGGWAALAAPAVSERRLQAAPACSGSGEKDINTTSSASFLRYRSLPIISFSGHPAQASLHLLLPQGSVRWAAAALHFFCALLNLKSPSLVWSLQCLTLSALFQRSQRPSIQTRVDAGGSMVIFLRKSLYLLTDRTGRLYQQ